MQTWQLPDSKKATIEWAVAQGHLVIGMTLLGSERHLKIAYEYATQRINQGTAWAKTPIKELALILAKTQDLTESWKRLRPKENEPAILVSEKEILSCPFKLRKVKIPVKVNERELIEEMMIASI